MDFVTPSKRTPKKDLIEIYPKFRVGRSKDLMIRGGDFYAVWDEEESVWATDQDTVIRLIDKALDEYASRVDDGSSHVVIKHMRDSESGSIDRWRHFVQKQMEDNWVPLDGKLIFSNTEVKREDYSSHRLNYPLSEGDYSSFNELLSVLYSAEERLKIEWAIGAVVSGDSVKIQKFMVFVGDAGTGKSTVLKIIRMLFNGYTATIDAKAIGSPQSAFALESLKKNPLVAIQDDADLSSIRDNTRLNSLVSHEFMSVNEKFKSPYEHAYRCFIFLGSNEDVQITDSRSGIQRRLIDVRPTGKTFTIEKYTELMDRIPFELNGIAYHCLKVYESNKHRFDRYKPTQSMRNTNPFYNFIEENYDLYKSGVSLKRAWDDYNRFCDENGLTYRLTKLNMKTEMSTYFKRFIPEGRIPEIGHVYNWYDGIRPDKFGKEVEVGTEEDEFNWLKFDKTESALDKLYSEQPAQYAKDDGTPKNKWNNVKTKLKDIDKSKLYWMKFPENVIKMDFDLTNENGEKSLEENVKAASKFPPTYAELSKSGQGIHLYYIYDGDPSKLEDMYGEHIEIKKSYGDRSHRRLITRCNDLQVAHISTGLPLKGEEVKVVDENVVATEKGLRTTILKCTHKEVHGDTRSNIDFIYKVLEDAYSSGLKYDVTDMRQDVLIFAMNSTHQSEYCVNKVGEMKFSSEEAGQYDDGYDPDGPIIFFDYEVFPNLVLLSYKYAGEGKPVIKLFNPTPAQIEDFLGFGHKYKNKIIGFNNKEYDNHITYAILMGKTTYEIFMTSQGIINNEKGAKYREAYNLSYSDIRDFCPNKQSLKKWEIQLGIHHQELGFKWDEPVPEKDWITVASYCENDVIATEAVFNANQAAWKGRQILVDLANILMGPGSTVNDSTNQLTTKLIVGKEKNPQRYYNYPDLAKEFPGYEFNKFGIDKSRYISKDVIISGKSIYKGYDPGEGGFVWANHGMHGRAISFDSASHHPSSIIAENGFGKFTENFKRLLDLRLHVKHKEYDVIRSMYNGALAKYLQTDEDADALSFALKIAINSVYGLTAATFPHQLRDPRNVDNWVAKRGALFMIDLMLNVRAMGYTVLHCKTDSIKVLNPDKKVANYIYEYGKKFGYTFEIEHIFDRICLVNDAVYVCKYTDDPENGKYAGKWDATGKQFQVPYVFKTLFSHEDIEFEDMCETKNVTTALYLDYNENLPEGEHDYRFVGRVGQFCPIKPGCGGGILLREKDGKYAAAESTKGYRWLESEVVKKLGKEADIDRSYYEVMVKKALDTINEFGSYEKFVSDEPIDAPLPDFMNIPETDEEELPFE